LLDREFVENICDVGHINLIYVDESHDGLGIDEIYIGGRYLRIHYVRIGKSQQQLFI